MEKKSVRVVSNGTIEKTVISEETDLGARGKSFVNVIDVDEKEEGPQDSALRDSKKDRAVVRKSAIDKDPLGAAL